MSLATTVEILQKRALTPSEMANLQEFQRHFKLDDNDPLMVVLAMMARSQLIVETVPDLLQQKVTETIELHKSVLRDQAVLISKELIKELTHQILAANANGKAMWARSAACFVAGILFVGGFYWMFSHFVK